MYTYDYSMYGFKFHHAEGDSSSMLLWLASSDNRVPPFATHHVSYCILLLNICNVIIFDRDAKCVTINRSKLQIIIY